MADCPRCDDYRWVCENHPERPWEGPRACACGGTPIRAAAALKRRIASCQLQARKMGTPFPLKHIIRKKTKAKCEAAERVARQ